MRERPHIAVLIEVAHPPAAAAEKDALFLSDEGAVGGAVAGGPDAFSDAARKVAVLIDGVRMLRRAPLMGMILLCAQFGALLCAFGAFFRAFGAFFRAFGALLSALSGAGDGTLAAQRLPLLAAGQAGGQGKAVRHGGSPVRSFGLLYRIGRGRLPLRAGFQIEGRNLFRLGGKLPLASFHRLLLKKLRSRFRQARTAGAGGWSNAAPHRDGMRPICRFARIARSSFRKPEFCSKTNTAPRQPLPQCSCGETAVSVLNGRVPPPWCGRVRSAGRCRPAGRACSPPRKAAVCSVRE